MNWSKYVTYANCNFNYKILYLCVCVYRSFILYMCVYFCELGLSLFCLSCYLHCIKAIIVLCSFSVYDMIVMWLRPAFNECQPLISFKHFLCSMSYSMRFQTSLQFYSGYNEMDCCIFRVDKSKDSALWIFEYFDHRQKCVCVCVFHCTDTPSFSVQ